MSNNIRPDLTNLPNLTNPTTISTEFVVVDGSVGQYLSVEQAAELLATIGPTGPQGTQGTQGTQGVQGLQGVQGPQGLQGVQGIQGLQGLQGLQGTQGTQGLQGTQGTQGLQGLQGVQGPQASQGTQGLQGLSGQGVQGNQGTQGIQGIQGITPNVIQNLAGGVQGSIPMQNAPNSTAYIPLGPANYVLSVAANGTTATWVSTTTIFAGNANYANEVFVAGLTPSSPTWASKQYLTMVTSVNDNSGENINAPSNLYFQGSTQILSAPMMAITATTVATNTSTGALTVQGGVGIGGDLFVQGQIVANELIVVYTTITTTIVETGDIITTSNTSKSTSTNTGALQVAGGAGIGGNLFVGGVTTVTNTTPAVSTTTGALTVAGGLGVGGDIYFNGYLYQDGSQFIGKQGPTGPQGAQGTQGLQGLQGPQSSQGTQGVQGPLGQGIQGFAGSSQGIQGIQGPLGPQGIQGIQGQAPSQGYQGPQGRQGPCGPQGQQGQAASQGTQGLQGLSGQGIQGTQGQQGQAASQGIQGIQGIQGNEFVGSQGSTGPQGTQGVQGRQGVQGPQGVQGIQGYQGPTGPQGTQGIQGLQGTQGLQGRQGVQGTQGYQGIQGNYGPLIREITAGVSGAGALSYDSGTGVLTFNPVDFSSIPSGTLTTILGNTYALSGGSNATGSWPISITGGAEYIITEVAGGAGHSVYLGWNGTNLLLQIDSTGFGANWPINITGNANSATSAGSATLASKASTLANGGGNGAPMTFNNSTQSGSPTYVWGTGDLTDIYLYQTSNLNVATAGLADTVTISYSSTLNTNCQLLFGNGDNHVYGSANLYVQPSTGALYSNNNITAFASSDKKFKENIRPIPNALNTVVTIGGNLFDWTDEYLDNLGMDDEYFNQKSDFGVIAQDVQEVFPIAVRTRKDGSLAVDYQKLVALAFEAIKELKIELNEFKKKIPR